MGEIVATPEHDGIILTGDSFGDPSRQTILLVAGLGTQRVRWSVPFCEALAARGYRVIRFDNRDAGLSTHLTGRPAPDFGALAAALMSGRRPEVPYSLRDMTDDAVRLLDAFGIGAAHWVGRSMGGMIAQVAACEHPSRVLSLVSLMSSTGNPALPGPAPDVMAMMTRRAPDPATDEDGYLEHALAFARRLAGSGAPFDAEAHRALVLEEVRRGHDPAGFARQLAAVATAGDRRARLATITAPSLVIHGTEDPLIPPDCGRDTAAAIPGAEWLPLDGMGHDLPPAFQAAVLEGIVRTARRA